VPPVEAVAELALFRLVGVADGAVVVEVDCERGVFDCLKVVSVGGTGCPQLVSNLSSVLVG
jgi:hypothetical protein